jgi:hypothetical protein
MKRKTTKSSGNVFVDLGFDLAEAAVLQMRANVMSDLRLPPISNVMLPGQGCSGA